jgi:hypothetical protein
MRMNAAMMAVGAILASGTGPSVDFDSRRTRHSTRARERYSMPKSVRFGGKGTKADQRRAAKARNRRR